MLKPLTLLALSALVLFSVGCRSKKTYPVLYRPGDIPTWRVADLSEDVIERPVVVIATNLGSFTVELFEEESPVSVENFLRYVEAGHYDGTIFHRVIPGFMVQGGGFTRDMREKVTSGTILNESNNGLRNRRGTVAMARTADPQSASAQFFVNVVDNNFLDGGTAADGYAVFGRVVDGMSVVDLIAGQETSETDAPLRTVEILAARRES